MGKASRRKNQVERSWQAKRCLHCGAVRDLGRTVVWCSACTEAGRRRSRVPLDIPNGRGHWPSYKQPNPTQLHWLRFEFWDKDPRFKWPMHIEDDLDDRCDDPRGAVPNDAG